jgi:PAS domain S-box-containing protein
MKSLKSYVAKGQFYRSVVDDGTDLVFVVDYEGVILYHNASVRELGYRTLTGKNFVDFLPDETKEGFRQNFDKTRRKAYSASVEFEFLTKSGERQHFEYNAINLKHKEGVDGIILDCRNITQRKKMAAALVEAQKAKDLFLANISHEIRTPINGIVGMTTLLSQEVSPQDQHSYLAAIRTAAGNLKVIINDILDLAAIESGKVQLERIEFELRHLLQTLLDTFQAAAMEKRIGLQLEIASDVPQHFLGDPVRLNQVLTNLIGNAMKFTHQGHIAVRCRVDQRSGATIRLCFEVTDTGIGIPPDKLNSIFESFTQADASITRRYGGTGLGLTIARQLISLLEGSISVRSQVDKGSAFTVVVPLTNVKPRTAKAGTETKLRDVLAFEPLNVLLVEDNEINRIYADSLLRKWNCRVEVAENGKIAVEKLALQPFDLVLMDVQMPVMDGFEATRAIRMGPEPARSVPILALTANASLKYADRCLEAGMDECISKPFTPDQLFRKLQKYKPRKLAASGGSGINLTYLHSASPQDAEFVKTMVDAIVSNLPDNINDIQQHLDQQQWTKLAESVHRVKSSLTMIGMEQVRREASEIEEMVYNQRTEAVAERAAALCRTLGLALQELKGIAAGR